MDVLALRDRAAARFDDFVTTLAQMVNVDCGSYSPAGVNAIADLCEARFGDGGWEVERRPHEPADGAPPLGDLLIGTLRGSGGPRILLISRRFARSYFSAPNLRLMAANLRQP